MDESAALQPSPWRAAALVGVLSCLLGLIWLGHRSLWFDETYDGVHARQTWFHLLHTIGATEMSQAMYLVLLKPWVALTPHSDWWLRLPSVVAAALAVALVVPLGARLFDRTTGILAGVLLATNQLLVAWSQQARTYALVTLAVVVATLLFVRALDFPTRRNWLLYALAAACAVYCHFYAGFVVVAHVASLPFAPAPPPRRRVVEAAVAFLVLIGVAVYFTATAGRGQLGWIGGPSFDGLRAFADTATGHNPVAGLAVIGGLAVLAYGVGVGRPGAAWRLSLVGGWIVLPAALGYLVSLDQPILVQRYSIVITPALALAGGVLIAAAARARREVAALALVAVVALSFLQIGRWYRGQPENWRAAVAYVDRVRHPGDAVVVVPAWAVEGVRYHDPSLPLVTSASNGRTLLVVRGGEGDDPAVVGGVPAATTLRTTHVQRFGRKLRVLTLER